MDTLGWKVLLKSDEFGKYTIQEGVGQRERVNEGEFSSVSFGLYVGYDASPSLDDFHLPWQFFNADLELLSMNNPV